MVYAQTCVLASKKYRNMFSLTNFVLGRKEMLQMRVNVSIFFFLISLSLWLVESLNQYLYVIALQIQIFYWQIEFQQRVRLVSAICI